MKIDVNTIVDFLTNVIADRQRSSEEKERAATALKYYAVKEDEANEIVANAEAVNAEAAKRGQPEQISPESVEARRKVALDYGREYARMLWLDPDDCVFSSYTGTDGIVRQRVTSKIYGGLRPDYDDETPKSAPGPMPPFEPAVPLPVLPPSDVETQAIKESSLTFDERYSPGAVSARVAAIEKEAAQMRASRERTE